MLIIIQSMKQKVYHGNLTSRTFANRLVSEFNRGSYHARHFKNNDPLIVQIAPPCQSLTGGQPADLVCGSPLGNTRPITCPKEQIYACLRFSTMPKLQYNNEPN